MANKSTYYKDALPKLMEQYKIAFEQCLKIIGDEIDATLGDDKIYNALRGKEKARIEAKVYANEINDLENEINGVHITQKVEKTGAEAFTVEK